LPVYKRYIGPSGGGTNAVHDCRRRAFDQRVFCHQPPWHGWSTS